MEQLKLEKVVKYVEENIRTFHQKRIDRLNELKLDTVLKKKNPYLFKAKHLLTSEKIVRSLTDAFISSNEETIFGDWLEGLAIFINNQVYGGWKSGINGIDLEFDKDGFRYIVNIKSGPNWGNASQQKKMKSDFTTAKKVLRTSNSGLQIVAINGCCYGKDNKPDKGDFFKFCGQKFWEFISNNENLYIEIIEPLGHKSKEKNHFFNSLYTKTINKFTKVFVNTFCDDDGEINWKKLVQFNSGK